MIDKRLLITSKSNFTILEAYNKPWYSNPKDKAKRLGVLHKATLRMKEDSKAAPSSSGTESCLARVIHFDRITNYVIEDYLNELSLIEGFKLRKSIVPTLGYYITENGLNIF
jgi:hypothetical protein